MVWNVAAYWLMNHNISLIYLFVGMNVPGRIETSSAIDNTNFHTFFG